MSDLPPAPPPPMQPTPPEGPDVQPQYSVPRTAANRWLGARAPYYGIGAGMLIYLLGYGIAIAFTLIQPDLYGRQLGAVVSTLAAGGLATVLTLILAIVLLAVPRTRAFGAGLAIALGIGVLCGGGVCVTLLAAAGG